MVTGRDALRKLRSSQRKLSYLEFLDQMERNHDIAVFDCHPGNYIETLNGDIVPIDLFPLRNPDPEHLRMLGM